jgi:hypothetical protein
MQDGGGLRLGLMQGGVMGRPAKKKRDRAERIIELAAAAAKVIRELSRVSCRRSWSVSGGQEALFCFVRPFGRILLLTIQQGTRDLVKRMTHVCPVGSPGRRAARDCQTRMAAL